MFVLLSKVCVYLPDNQLFNLWINTRYIQMKCLPNKKHYQPPDFKQTLYACEPL